MNKWNEWADVEEARSAYTDWGLCIIISSDQVDPLCHKAEINENFVLARFT